MRIIINNMKPHKLAEDEKERLFGEIDKAYDAEFEAEQKLKEHADAVGEGSWKFPPTDMIAKEYIAKIVESLLERRLKDKKKAYMIARMTKFEEQIPIEDYLDGIEEGDIILVFHKEDREIAADLLKTD